MRTANLSVPRPDFAVCHGQDQFGQSITVKGTGTLARCLQHETDHLGGIVMEDYLSPTEKRLLRRQHSKVSSDYPEGWPTNTN